MRGMAIACALLSLVAPAHGAQNFLERTDEVHGYGGWSYVSESATVPSGVKVVEISG